MPLAHVSHYRADTALTAVQRGMLRHVFLVLDMSRGMEANDLKPNRAAAAATIAKEFVREYFDQNPISQMGVIVMRHGRAEKMSDLSANPRRHADAIDAALAGTNGGDMSLQAALEAACRTLALIPSYGTREVVLLHGAISTADAGSISATIAELQRNKVRVSAISLPGEVYIVMRVAKETGGTCVVPDGYEHVRSALLAMCQPPARRKEELDARVRMVLMGFPRLVFEEEGICACHAELRPRGFLCPRCDARMCELPSTCAVCQLQLVSAPSLARSYHHLFPVPHFVEVPDAHRPGRLVHNLPHPFAAASAAAGASDGGQSRKSGIDDSDGNSAEAVAALPEDGEASEHQAPEQEQVEELVHSPATHCEACQGTLPPHSLRYVCPLCRISVCAECEQVIHETLHNCPGCLGSGRPAENAQTLAAR